VRRTQWIRGWRGTLAFETEFAQFWARLAAHTTTPFLKKRNLGCECVHLYPVAQSPKVRKAVICSRCKRRFQVVGSPSTLREVAQGVRCPYEGCFEMNEILLPFDSEVYSVEMLAARSATVGKAS